MSLVCSQCSVGQQLPVGKGADIEARALDRRVAERHLFVGVVDSFSALVNNEVVSIGSPDMSLSVVEAKVEATDHSTQINDYF